MGQKKVCIKNPTPSGAPSGSKKNIPDAKKQLESTSLKKPEHTSSKKPAPSPKAKSQPAQKKQKIQQARPDIGSSSRNIAATAWSKKRKAKLAGKPIGAHKYVDWALISSYGIETEIKQLLSIGPWEALFNIRTPAYPDITVEVLSTLELDDKDYSKGVQANLSFMAYGKYHQIPLSKFCVYMGLYSEEEIKSEEFQQLSNSWPTGANQINYWKIVCESDLEYYPSKSKSSSIKNVHYRVIHWMFANTIGARKSSTGVVNNFELFLIHSIATRYKINVGVELAHYLCRQASDPRSKGIYCGGYITKLLQGMKVFKQPAADSSFMTVTKVTDGPFAGWGLEKLIQSPKRVYSTPPPTKQFNSPGASTSHAPLETERRLDRIEKEMKKERQRTKKFRAFIVDLMQSMAKCLQPPPTDLPSYSSTSSDSDGQTTPPPAPASSKGKEKLSLAKSTPQELSSESEEEDNEDDDVETNDEQDDENDDEEDEDDEEEEEEDDDDQGKKGD